MEPAETGPQGEKVSVSPETTERDPSVPAEPLAMRIVAGDGAQARPAASVSAA